MLPVDHIPHLDKAAVQRAAGVDSPIVGGHHIALLYGVFQPQLKGVHIQLMSQFIDSRFYGKQSLRCAVTAVSTGRHVVRIHHITDKAEGFCLAVQWDGLVTGKAHGRRAMLTVSTGIGKGVQINALHNAVLRGTQPHMDLHFVTRRGCDLAFHTTENDLGGLFGLPCHKSRIYLTDRRLLGTKSAADAGLCHAHHGFGNMQCVRNIAPCMEHDLRGAEHIQPPIGINGAVGTEGLHHGLLAGLGVVHMVNDYIAGRQYSIDIAGTTLIVGAEVAFVVGSHRAQTGPVVLRMHQNGVVLGSVIVQHCFQNLILHLDELESLIHALFVLTGHNGHHIAHKTHMAVNEQAVTRTGFRIGLASLRVARRILRHILPCKDCLDAGHLFCYSRIDRFDDGICVRRAQQLYNQAVLRDHIVHIDGLAGDQLHGILFTERLVDGTHSAASFCFFHARKFMMPRSWPS